MTPSEPRDRLARGCGREARHGFSLVEALIALALSGVILTLVATVFFAQNRFYDDVSARSDVQETIRSAGELVAGDVRAVARGGIVIAESGRLVARTPLAIGIACGPAPGGQQHAYFPFDGAPPDPDEVQGWAVRSSSGDWSYATVGGDDLLVGSGAASRTSCQSLGADDSGPAGDFIQLGHGAVSAGQSLLLFSEIELRFAPSELQDGRLALFRGIHDASLVEFATGVTTRSGFQYRFEDGTFHSTVTGADLARIDQVRIFVEAVPATPGGSTSGSMSGSASGRSIDIPLRNVM